MNTMMLERDEVIRTLLEGKDIASVATGEEKKALIEQEIKEKVQEQVSNIERDLRRKFYEERTLYQLEANDGSRSLRRSVRASSKGRTKQ